MGGQLQLPVPTVTVTFGLEVRRAPIGGLDVMAERKTLPLSGNKLGVQPVFIQCLNYPKSLRE